jgi:hypothetical protein
MPKSLVLRLQAGRVEQDAARIKALQAEADRRVRTVSHTPRNPGNRRCIYCSTAVMFRFGTWPTAIFAASFMPFTSTTLTEFEPAQAT